LISFLCGLARGYPLHDAELRSLAELDEKSFRLRRQKRASKKVLIPERDRYAFQKPLHDAHPGWLSGYVVEQQEAPARP
jgi:hypothetical protein